MELTASDEVIPTEGWSRASLDRLIQKTDARGYTCLLAAPASQAYVERIFSVCGLLTAGRRNRMSKSLEMRACLKLNSRVLKETGFVF